jgi:kynurenine formamidase
MSGRASTGDGSANSSSNSRITTDSIVRALGRVHAGRVFSLESQWWGGMPVDFVHPRFEVLTYRSPHGVEVQRDHDFLKPPANAVGLGFVSELIIGTAHTGTHIDALCHVTCGPRAEWHGGHSAHEYLGDFGALNSDAAALPAIIARGVLLDVPRALGLPHCPPRYAISGEDLAAACEQQGTEIQPGDVVLVRTGTMSFWPDVAAMAAAEGAGVSLDAARWLAGHDPVAVGADNVAFECFPSGVEGNPLPVHLHLIQQNGIPILEWVNCEELAGEQVYDFTFICLPLSVIGASGSMVRPIAVV